MNEQSKSLLVVKTTRALNADELKRLEQMMTPLCKEFGAKMVAADGGTDVALYQDLSPLVDMMGKQVAAISRLAASNEALVQAMAEVEGNDPGDVAALPARGLNGRPL